LGLLNAHDAFRGLSSNAVIAIIGVMIISYGLNRAGLVSRMLQPVLPIIQKSASRLVTIFSGLIAAVSSVMQNTGAAVLFLPAIRLTATHKLKVPISRVLMPIGMAAILGGTLTMIGTSPLILLNDILPQGMPKFGFLELTPIGLALVIGGILFLSTGGMAILSASSRNRSGAEKDVTEKSQDTVLDSYPLITGPYEVFVPEDSRAEKESPEMVAIRRHYLVNIVATIKGRRHLPDGASSQNGHSRRPLLVYLRSGRGRRKICAGLRPGPQKRAGPIQEHAVQPFHSGHCGGDRLSQIQPSGQDHRGDPLSGDFRCESAGGPSVGRNLLSGVGGSAPAGR
jgi:hypothetical protein